ncbi:hypothetical protein V6N13_092424 [Hibiscus sabdariffa]
MVDGDRGEYSVQHCLNVEPFFRKCPVLPKTTSFCYRKHEQKGFDPIFDARMSDHRGKISTGGYNADQP